MSSALSKINSRASLDRSPKKNWVESSGGLPMYIRRIANHLHQEKGMTIGHGIAVAVNAVKKMCSTGDLNFNGKQNVNAGSRAEACAAVSQWEKKKAGARVSKGVLGRKWSDDEFIAFLVNETDMIEKQFNPNQPRDADGQWTDGLGGPSRKMPSWMKKAPSAHRAAYRKLSSSQKERYEEAVDEYGADHNDAWDYATGGYKNGQVVRKSKKSSKKLRLSDEEFENLAGEINAEINADVEFEAHGEIEKRDDDKQLVFGWCSIAKHADGEVEVDRQGDVLEDIDQMEAVAYDFVLHSRDGGEMHVRKGVSTLVESFVSTPEKWEAMGIPTGTLPTGWWVGYKVNDEEVWKGVKSGKYRMFSVHGSGTRKALTE